MHAGEDDLHERMLKFFGRHLVAVCVTYRIKEEGAEGALRFASYNGTLIEIRGMTCFLTAGHVLTELKAALADDRLEILDAALADTFGEKRISDKPVPFDIKNESFHIFDHRDLGLDFGVIILRPYYVRLLKRNGVVALTEERWVHQHRVDFDIFALLGLPQEHVSPVVSESGNGTVSPVMFGVRRLDDAPPDVAPTHYPWFVGAIRKDLPIKSIKGMSGGPIFGFRVSKDVHYWVVALQSWWLPERRIIFGCPLPTIASLLTEGVEESLKSDAQASAVD